MKNSTLTKGQQTKQKILEGALEVMQINGIEETSFKMIADHIGLSQQGVMNHFKNRDTLFIGLLSYIKDKLYAEIEADFSPYDNAFELIKKHFMAQLRTIKKYPVSMQMYLWLYYKASHKPEYKNLYTETHKAVKDQYLKYILAGQRENLFKIGDSAEFIAEKLHDSFMGSIINFSTTNKTKNKEKFLIAKWEDLIKNLLQVD